MPSISWASYFRADHSIVLSVYPFGELFLCRPSLGESYFRTDHLILHPLASYFNVYHISYNSPPSIPMTSYFCAIHPLGKLFSCRPFNSPVFGECRPYNSPPIHPFGELFLCRPSLWRAIFVPTIQLSIRPSLWRVIFVSSIRWASYFRADHLILHPLASYFNVYH